MAGGPAFLRPVDEFTTRLCYVCFDGTEALSFSKEVGLSTDLPEDFVHKYCTNVYQGIKVSLESVFDRHCIERSPALCSHILSKICQCYIFGGNKAHQNGK